MNFLRIVGRSVLDFFREDGLMLAGSLSFFLIMALIPFCLFLITLFGHLLGNYPEFYKFFLNKVINFFPDVTHDITADFSKLITYKGIGKFSLVLYGLLSYQVFASLENALNALFKVGRKRHVILSILISLVVVAFVGAFLIIAFAAASFLPLLKSVRPFGMALQMGMIKSFIITSVLPFLLVLLSVMVAYLMIPKARVRLLDAFSGALFTTTFFEIAKHVFTWYVETVVQFGRIYGPLTVFIVFLLWVFYSSCIFLIGGKVVYNAGNRKGRAQSHA